jgi:pSer/pThr/pTyr-binding forkhead associated (FHA) protein
MEVKLVIANGKQAGTEIPVKSAKFVIGRNEDCQLRPQSHLVSRRHCVISIEANSVVIEDLGSTNGTLVNGEKITGRRELKAGDRIKVGLLEVDLQLSVALGGKWKPKVQSVQEAIARTAASASAKDDDFDVSSWLGEDDLSLTVSTPAKKPPASDETVAGKGLVDTTTIPVPPTPHKKEEEKKNKEASAKTGSKTATKFNQTAKPKTDSSGAAAEDALRQFFHRKKA